MCLEAEHCLESSKYSVELVRPKVSNSSWQKCKQVEVITIMAGKVEEEDGGGEVASGGLEGEGSSGEASGDLNFDDDDEWRGARLDL